MKKTNEDLWVGVDVGSTTVKIAVVDPATSNLLHYSYQRHNAMQAAKVMELLTEAHALFPGKTFGVAFCGSGGQPFAEATRAFFVQEVVANALAVRATHPETRVLSPSCTRSRRRPGNCRWTAWGRLPRSSGTHC